VERLSIWLFLVSEHIVLARQHWMEINRQKDHGLTTVEASDFVELKMIAFYCEGLSYASYCGVRMTPHSAASHWRRNPTTSKTKPYTVNGNAR
jgi:hypothetical protein